MSLIGEESASNVWVSLNHVALTGDVDWNQVGFIMASDVLLFSNSSYIISSDTSGILIGFKIAVSTSDDHYGYVNCFHFNLDNWD